MSAEHQNRQKPVRKHLSPAFAVVAGTVALALCGAFNSFAHVPSAAKNQEQHDMLAPYTGFIMHMENPSGGLCCGMQDGVGNIPERHTDYPAFTDRNGQLYAFPSGTHYHVELTKDDTGKPLPNGGIWLDVPDSQILNAEHAKNVCAKHTEDPTCKAPPFNILWHGPFDKSNPNDRPAAYCLWPRPGLQ